MFLLAHAGWPHIVVRGASRTGTGPLGEVRWVDHHVGGCCVAELAQCFGVVKVMFEMRETMAQSEVSSFDWPNSIAASESSTMLFAGRVQGRQLRHEVILSLPLYTVLSNATISR